MESYWHRCIPLKETEAVVMNSCLVNHPLQPSPQVALLTNKPSILFIDVLECNENETQEIPDDPDNPVKLMCVSNDGKFIVTANKSSVTLFTQGNNISVLTVHLYYTPQDIDIIKLPSEETTIYWLLCAGANGLEFYAIDTSSLTILEGYPISLHDSLNVIHSKFSIKGDQLVIAGLDGHIGAWRLDSDNLFNDKSNDFWVEYLETDRITSIAISPNSNYIAVASWNGIIYVYRQSVQSHKLTYSSYIPRYGTFNSGIVTVAWNTPPVFVTWSPNSSYIIFTENNNQSICVSDINTGIPIILYAVDSPIKGLSVHYRYNMFTVYTRNKSLYSHYFPLRTVANNQNLKCNLIESTDGILDIVYSYPDKCSISKLISTTLPSPLQLEVFLKTDKRSITVDVPFISELEFDRMYDSVHNFSYNHLDVIHSPKISFSDNYLLISIESILYVYNFLTSTWKHYLLTCYVTTFTVDKNNTAIILQKDKKIVFIDLHSGQVKDTILHDINTTAVNNVQLFSCSDTEFAIVSIEYKQLQQTHVTTYFLKISEIESQTSEVLDNLYKGAISFQSGLILHPFDNEKTSYWRFYDKNSKAYLKCCTLEQSKNLSNFVDHVINKGLVPIYVTHPF